MSEPVPPPEPIAEATTSDAPPTPEQEGHPVSELLAPVDPASPESGDRITATNAALDSLKEAAKGSAHPFRRNIEKVQYVPDTRSQAAGTGLLVEQRVPVETGDERLHTIDLRTFPDENSTAAYHMSLSFMPDGEQAGQQSSQLMLSIESPVDLGWRFGITDRAKAGEAGIIPQGRRIQDYLYVDGAEEVPVRQADFSHVYSYRLVGEESSHSATRGEMDVLLGILADSHVMQPDGQKGPKAAELAPQLKDLVSQPVAAQSVAPQA